MSRATALAAQDVDAAYNQVWWDRGQTVGTRSFAYSDGWNASSTPALALGAGNYSLYVSATGDFSGDYAFRLANLAQATPVNFDADTAVTLDPAGGSAFYSFSASAGDRITFQQTGSGPENAVIWRVLDAYGRQITGPSSFGGYAELPALDADGTYTLVFEGNVGTPGSSSF